MPIHNSSLVEVSIPPDAKIIDAKGKVIMPGFADTHTHIGLDWGFDYDSKTQPDIRILDAINPNHDFLIVLELVELQLLTLCIHSGLR